MAFFVWCEIMNVSFRGDYMSSNKRVKYCIYCGTECDENVAVCPNCNKSFTERENLFIEFLIEKTKDKYKGDLEDSLVDIIINFIKSHLYGFILTICIVGVTIVNVASADFYIKNVTREPGSDSAEVVENYTSDQKDIIQVVDDYFYYARNFDNKADASEKLEKLMSPIITTEVMPGYPVTSTHDALKPVDADSATYRYAIVYSDIDYSTTIISTEFRAEGYRVAEVVVYETLKKGNQKMEGLFLVTLRQEGNVWTVNESLSSYGDEKLLYYEEDYLYTMMDEVLWPYNERYSLEDIEKETRPYLMPSVAGLKPNITIEASDERYYYCRELTMSLKWETELAKQLAKKYRIAQANLTCRVNGKDVDGVITFVNMNGMWYVAEMTVNE